MAGGIANAATRSVANGTDFGDNLLAALPDVIGDTIGDLVANGLDEVNIFAARVVGRAPPVLKGSDLAAGTPGVLSVIYETSDAGPGKISDGQDDPGGVSYGSFQLTTNKGDAAMFVVSKEAAPWAKLFKNLRPDTPAFNAVWDSIAQSDPQAFHDAQYAFVKRKNYDPVVEKIKTLKGLDVSKMSLAAQATVFSTSTQFGTALNRILAAIKVADAATATDKSAARGTIQYDANFIKAVYAERTRFLQVKINNSKTAKGDKNTFRNVITNRYPDELRDALYMLYTRAPKPR